MPGLLDLLAETEPSLLGHDQYGVKPASRVSEASFMPRLPVPVNIGEVGSPTPQQRKQNALPMPLTVPSLPFEREDVTDDFAEEPAQNAAPAPAPARPVMSPLPSPAAPVPSAAPERAPVPALSGGAASRALPRDDGRSMLRAVGQALVAKGSPAQRVQGIQMLYEANQPTPEEREEAEYQRKRRREKEEMEEAQTRQLGYLDELGLDPEAAKRGKFGVQMGFKPEQLADVTGIDLRNRQDQRERAEKLTAWGKGMSGASRDLGVLKDAAQRSFKLIDEGTMTTGLKGYAAQFVPGSDANQLLSALEPMQRLIGFGRLQEMREASKTGGALGNVSDTEGRWLASVQGSLDPVQNDPEVLKENIAGIVAGQTVLMKMRRLVPLLDAGDPKAWDEYAGLSEQLGGIGEQVRARLQAEKKAKQQLSQQRPTMKQDSLQAQPPKAGARQAPDGNWYVER